MFLELDIFLKGQSQVIYFFDYVSNVTLKSLNYYSLFACCRFVDSS